MRASRPPEYEAWRSAKKRCHYRRDKSFARYGGRGITVCAQWLTSFDAFYRDMGPRPSPRHSLDRIDVNGHYEPGNCRWATPEEQSANRRKCIQAARGTLTSQFVGVRRHRQRWEAGVRSAGQFIYLGTYATEEEAARVRDAHVLRHGLPHALNFPKARAA